MKILIVSATKKELSSLEKKLIDEDIPHEIDMLIAGVGGYATIYHLLKTLSAQKYDLVINIGIAGSFNPNILVGHVVWVQKEQFVDIGIDSPEGFISLFEAGFEDKDKFPYSNGEIECAFPDFVLPENVIPANAITSSIAHGKNECISQLVEKYNPDIETMEGAAVYFVCKQEAVPCIGIRAISNMVEKRDISKWDIPVALENLSSVMLSMLKNIK